MFVDAIKKAKFGISFLRKGPVHVNLQVLYQCNFRCGICDFWKKGYDGRQMMSAGQVEIIAEKLKKIGPQVFAIGGGEPLMHPEIVDISRILSRDHFGAMITNGWFVTGEFARDLFRAGLYEISVSVDYADPEKHDALRGKRGAYDRALNALKLLNENRLYSHQRVHMISTVFDDNLPDIEPLIRLSRDLGITYLISFYSGSRGDMPQIRDRQAVRDRLGELHKKYRHFVALRGYIDGLNGKREGGGPSCYCGRNLINIDPGGDVSLCIDRADESAGNIFQEDMKTIEENLLKMHQDNRCSDCWTSCRGSIETVMYGKRRLANLFDYYQMTRGVMPGGTF